MAPLAVWCSSSGRARSADLVVVVGTQAHVDPVGDAPVEVWDTGEPSLRGVEDIERTRLIGNDIAARVTDLSARLTGSPQ